VFFGGALYLDMSFGSGGRLATLGPGNHEVLIWDALGRRKSLSREIARVSGIIEMNSDATVVASSPTEPGARIQPSSIADPLVGQVTLMDARTGHRIHRFAVTQGEELHKLIFSPDGRYIAVEYGGGGGYQTAVWEVSGDPKPVDQVGRAGTFAGWAPEGDTLALAGNDGVLLWRPAGGVMGRLLEWPGGWNGDGATFSQRGDTVAIPGREGVAIYDVVSGARLDLLEFDRPAFAQVEAGTLETMAFDPAGPDLVLGTSDQGGRLLVWNPHQGRRPEIPPPYRLDRMWSVAYSPDGDLVATATDLGLQLWDARAGRPIGTLAPLPQTLGWRLAFSSNGRWLMSIGLIDTPRGTLVNVLTLWDVRVGDWIGTACRVAGRDLSRAEWNRFLPGELYHATCRDA
jgi:WD40 repeat protein